MRICVSLLTVLWAGGLSACGGDDGGRDTGVSCDGAESRCDGDSYQICGSSDTFIETEVCGGAAVCDPTMGCVACQSGQASTCVGDEVFACEDGAIGDKVETCAAGGCQNGSCTSTANCTGNGVELIYLVDDSYQLLSFDPSLLGSVSGPFKEIGQLSCPAGASWPDWEAEGPATPFSMAVDRRGTAWVLYTSGEIFHVSTQDASCQATAFSKGQLTFELFGMGFVSDAVGSNEETLYIAGGGVNELETGNLGRIDSSSLQVSNIGALPTAEYGPELTGTGDAKLYAYFPGLFDSYVANLVKESGAKGESWDLASLGAQARAWAFAHWGGKFYVFITTQNTGTPLSRVIELDPSNGAENVVVASSDYIVVGAGVSTCAPVQVD